MMIQTQMRMMFLVHLQLQQSELGQVKALELPKLLVKLLQRHTVP